MFVSFFARPCAAAVVISVSPNKLKTAMRSCGFTANNGKWRVTPSMRTVYVSRFTIRQLLADDIPSRFLLRRARERGRGSARGWHKKDEDCQCNHCKNQIADERHIKTIMVV